MDEFEHCEACTTVVGCALGERCARLDNQTAPERPIQIGSTVRIFAGKFNGMAGVVVGQATNGKWIVQIPGVIGTVEIPENKLSVI